jgi:hypothetical protein
MEFYNGWVVLGEDNAGGYSSIDRFRDDGTDSLFVTQAVWLNPFITNFYGGTKLGNHLVFATGREGHDGTLYILESTDAQNWNVIDSVFTSSNNDNYRGILNPHPNRNGRIYTCQVVGSAAYFTARASTAPVVDGVINPGEYDGGMAVQLVGRTVPSWTVDAYIDWDAEYLYVAVNEPVPPGGGTTSWIEFCFDAGPARAYLDGFALFSGGSFHHTQCPKPPGSWGVVPYSFLAASSTATEFRVKYTDFGVSLGGTIKMSIDRNQGPSPPPPYGFAAFWPQNAIVYFAPPDPTTWGDVMLTPPSPPPVSLTVVSAYDSPSPSGTTSYTPGTGVTAVVTSPWPPAAVGTRYVCTGWTGTGSVPSSGSGTTVTFTINQDSGITWLWKTQYYLTVTSAYDTPTGQGWYDANTPVTSSVDLMVHVGSNFYKCTGWTGTGSAPASGTGNTVSFTITQASSVTWKWGSSVGGEWFPATTLPTVAPSNVLQLLAPWIVLAFVAASVFAAYRKLFKKRW